MCELCLYKYKSLAFNPFFFPTEDVCPIPMDTTFIIDSSFCDGNGHWNRLLKFVQTLVTFYDVSPSGGRIALIPFGTNANVVLKFNTLTGSLLNGAEVNRRVSRLQCQRGFRRIDKALDLAYKEVLTSAGGMRDVSRVKYLRVYSPPFALKKSREGNVHVFVTVDNCVQGHNILFREVCDRSFAVEKYECGGMVFNLKSCVLYLWSVVLLCQVSCRNCSKSQISDSKATFWTDEIILREVCFVILRAAWNDHELSLFLCSHRLITYARNIIMNSNTQRSTSRFFLIGEDGRTQAR